MKKDTSKKTPETADADSGVLLKGANGDVIAYDRTGLIMRLSDKVINDISKRLGPSLQAPQAPLDEDTLKSIDPPLREEESSLAGVDAWDVTIEGDWLRFMANLPGLQGTRRFCRHREGGAIIADAPVPFYGLFTLGGQGASLAAQCKNRFPHHVFAADDDIGAVGQAGEGTVATTDKLMELREQTLEALVGEYLLLERFNRHDTLPLFMVRTESDASGSAADFLSSQAMDNLTASLKNFVRAANLLNKKPRIMAINLDFVLDDVISSAGSYRDNMLKIMAKIESVLSDLGLQKPLFVMRLETSGPATDNPAAVEGQWELAWNHAEHNLLVCAPGYMFELDPFARPTEVGLRDMAQMTAAAISNQDKWKCPIPHLAEIHDQSIRVTFQGEGELVIDEDDPFGAGASAGFSLQAARSSATITRATIDEADPMTLILELSKPLRAQEAFLLHACGESPKSAIRDTWTHESAREGTTIHRWALPAKLPVHGVRR